MSMEAILATDALLSTSTRDQTFHLFSILLVINVSCRFNDTYSTLQTIEIDISANAFLRLQSSASSITLVARTIRIVSPRSLASLSGESRISTSTLCTRARLPARD